MDRKTRTLLKVILPISASAYGDEELAVFIENLMGRKPEKRFSFIQENAVFAQSLDV